MAIQTVIKKIQPNGSGSSVYLGAEQRFVGPLKNTHVNNLEEQYIIGTDCITEEWVLGTKIYTEKKFYNGLAAETPTEYYKLIIESGFRSSYGINDFLYDLDTLNEDRSTGDWSIYLGGEAAFDIKDKDQLDTLDANIYYFQNDDIFYINPPMFTTQVWKLYYHDASKIGNEDTLLITKEVKSQYITRILANGITVNALRTIDRIIENSETGETFTGVDLISLVSERTR